MSVHREFGTLIMIVVFIIPNTVANFFHHRKQNGMYELRVTNCKLQFDFCMFMTVVTSCARGETICPRPSPPPVDAVAPRAAAPADDNVAAVSHAQYVPTLTAAAACA